MNLTKLTRYRTEYGNITGSASDGEWVKFSDVEALLSASTNSAMDAIALLKRCLLVIREGSLHKDICEFIERQRHQ